jgi:hypothetical protein
LVCVSPRLNIFEGLTLDAAFAARVMGKRAIHLLIELLEMTLEDLILMLFLIS